MKLSPKTRSRSIALILLMAATTVGSAFAIVWTQQQISRTAQSTKQIEADLAEMVRKIAAYHQPVVLQGKVAGALRPSRDNQVVWVREREMPDSRAYAVSAPYETSIDLAMLNANSNSPR